MKQKLILKLSIGGFFFVVFLGGLFHFTFELSGRNLFVALFSAVNESVWEHMKLSTFPFLLFAIIETRFLKPNFQNFMLAKTAEVYLAIAFMMTFFYGYHFVLGRGFLALDIGSFIIAVALGKTLSYQILTKIKKPVKSNLFWTVPLVILICFFFWATFYPPKLPPFKENLGGTYGFYQIK